jgi:putative ABC transport system permease protein
MIVVFGLIVLLINGYLISPNSASLFIMIPVLLVVGIAYINFITLQLRKRTKEFYIRKLLGARDSQVMTQLLLESMVLSTFLAVSGMVLAGLVSPWCDKLIGLSLAPLSLKAQILIIILLVIPVGLLSVAVPIRSFIGYLNKNFPGRSLLVN